jgi:DNA-binding HxlR family transcriptional regulator
MEAFMRPKRFDAKSGCAVGVTLSVIGGLWKPLILFHLFAGKKRFMELSRAIPNATQRILTRQLRELEADGVILRHAYPQIPPKVEYEISPFGQSLGPVLLSLRIWGKQFGGSIEGVLEPHHAPEDPQPNACLLG